MLKLLAIAVLVLGFLYWRGSKLLLAESGLDCQWNIVYAVCTGDKEYKQPSMIEIIKAGAKF